MKHLLRPQFLNFLRNLPCRRSLVHFPKTIPSPAELIHDTLKRRIERVQDSTVSITPLLREWFDLNGNQTKLIELKSIISSLSKSNRFFQALQVSDWMSEQKAYNLSSADFENRLMLIAQVRGVEEAAKFLETIPVEKRDLYVYNALLKCCQTHNSVNIAETTFQKMRELGFADNKSYNTMLCIYLGAEYHDMVVKLLSEIDNKEIKLEGVPFVNLLTSYVFASVKNVQGMEKFLSKWGKMIKKEWIKYYFPGLVYIEAGSKKKGFHLLRSSEQSFDDDDDSREAIYRCLMIFYCNEGQREDVSRLLNLAKLHNISFDSYTCSLISMALTKISDLDEVLEEWDEYPNLDMVDFGLQNRHVKEEADKVVNMLGKKESKLETLTNKLANLVEDEEDDKEEERRERVAEAMKGRLHDRWNPKSSLALSAYACVQYVEGRRDMESAADILRLLNKQDQVMHVMDKDRLSLKMMEAMRGGGYIGGED